MATPKTLTAEECEKLLEALLWYKDTSKRTPKGIRNHCIALLMLDAGLRVGEVVQLHPENLWYYGNPVTTLRIAANIAKNKTERLIPISQRIQTTVKKMDELWWCRLSNHATTFAFYQTNAEQHITTRQVERIIRSAAMKSLGRPVHPHILRHTFASRLMRTVSIRVVQELLGHKSLSSTQIYTHPNQEDLKKAIDGIDPTNIKIHAPFVE